MNPEPHFNLHSLGQRACLDLENVFERVDPQQLEILAHEIIAARRIVCYGAGREGLMMQAIAMRLMHAGLQSYVVGEMVTPRVGPGDLFLASAGPGHFPTIETLLKVAREAGGRTVVVTAQPSQASEMPVDVLVHLPGQTMADVAAGSSILTMGTHYEAALLLFGDFLVLRLLELTHQKLEDMYTRYTNMK
ncbi:MAG: SIS domain-containing protein [Verrucomicrobia bacterium]|nr:SIS domain-containing protein [Verrucomicrobiota bacterium]